MLLFQHNVFCAGLSLTLSDAGNKKVAIAGPPNLHKLITASRHFMKLPDHLLVWSACAKREDDPVTIVQNNEVMLQQVLISESAPGWGHFSYVGRSPALLGKFDVKKAMSLHVPKGELFGKLKNGHSVTLADGTVVRPEQVLGDAEPCKHFAVVCCVTAKDQALLQALINNAAINR
jgi:ribonuclease Z